MAMDYRPRSAFWAVAGVALGIAVAGLTAFVWGRLRIGREVDAQLVASRLAAQQILDLRFKRLELMSSAIADDPAFTGYVLEAADAGNDPFGGSQPHGGSRSVKDLLTERQTQASFDFGMVLDTNGGLVASTGSGPDDLAADPLFTADTRAHGAGTLYWLRNGRLYQVVVANLANHDQQAGYLALALAVDAVQLNALKQGGASEQLVFDTGSGAYVPVAGTLSGGDMGSVAAQLEAKRNLPQGSFNLDFGGGRWRAYASPLSSGGDNGVIVTLIAYDRDMQDTYGMLLLFGAEAVILLLLAAGLDFWLARRSPVWPKRT